MKHPFTCSADTWPGLAKVVEEAGELQQVAGKLMMTGGAVNHLDGSNLRDRLVEEIGDLIAATTFFCEENGIGELEIAARALTKLRLLREWRRDGRESGESR